MVSKAELDRMDLPSELEEGPIPEATEETPVTQEKTNWFSSRGRRFKLGLFGVVGCLLISAIGFGIWSAVGFFQAKQTALAREKIAAKQALATVAPRLVFQDFLIPLPEGSGYRILMINFVAELGKNRKQADLNSNAGIRRQVVNAIQLRGPELLSVGGNRDLLKKDLLGLMNEILGEGAVKNVYLTDFTFI
jgi:flagellar basal body-associated protein FliL